MGATDVVEGSGIGSDVRTGRRGSGTVWVVGGEESCSAGSSVAAAGWDDGESSFSAGRVWLDGGGEDFLCSLWKSQRERSYLVLQ